MDLEKKVQILEAAYVGVLADSVRCFNNEGILEKITEQKRKEHQAF